MDDVRAHELRLRRSADERRAATDDPELAAILARANERRSRRIRRQLGHAVEPGVEARIGSGSTPEGQLSEEPTREVAPQVAVGAAGRVLSIEQVGPDVRILRLGRPPNFSFEAGQYLKVGVEGSKRRSFSIASAPHERHIELCVELRPEGSLTPVLFGLRPGDSVELDAKPKGSFLLDPDAEHHFMVATVTGIAPLRAMVRDALHRGVPGRFTILHGASRPDELPYREELQSLAAERAEVDYIPTVSRPGEVAGWSGQTGRVDPLAVRMAAQLDRRRSCAYACGNAGMVAEVRRRLGECGLPVRTESYG